MKCKVISFEEREREGQLPYFVIRARGVQGDENADVFDEDGVINFNAVQSRVFNFTKSLFPGTEKQCQQLRDGFEVDEDGNVTNDRSIYLKLMQWNVGKEFYILNRNTGEFYTEQQEQTVEKIADKAITVNGKVVQKGQKYTITEVVEVPKKFNQISIVLLCDKEENCVEGNEEDIAKRNYETGISNGTYVIAE